REDDFFAADLVRERAKNQKKRRGNDEREADEDVGRYEVELKIDQEKKQRVELAGVPHHPLAGGRAEQRQGHIFIVRILEEAVDQRLFGALALRLHTLKDRGFLKF